jgi:O-antigen ligase
MIKPLYLFFLASWPLLSLITIVKVSEGLFTLDIVRPIVLILVLSVTMINVFGKNKTKYDSILIIGAIFLITVFLNFLVNGTGRTVREAVRDLFLSYGVPLLTYYWITNLHLKKRENLKPIIYATLFCVAIVSGVGLCEFLAAKNLLGSLTSEGAGYKGIYRTNGPFHEGIGYSAIVLLFIPYMYYLFSNKFITKKTYLCLSILCAVASLATFSRATMISMVAVLFILFFRKNVKSTLMLFFTAITAVVLMLGTYEHIMSSTIVTNRIADPANIVGRWNQYKDAFKYIFEHPFLGIGFDMYKKSHFYYMHNSFLRMFVELGLFGFIPFVVFCLSVIFSKSQRIMREKNNVLSRTQWSFFVISFFVGNTVDLLYNAEFLLSILIIVAVIHTAERFKVALSNVSTKKPLELTKSGTHY